TCDLIDLFDRVTIVQHRLDRNHRAECANTIGYEVWPILCGDYAFAKSLIEKAVEETRHFRLGPLSANYFDEMKVARRIEEMDAEEVCTKIFRATFGQLAD